VKRAMRILVPLDFSSYSWETLRFAVGLRSMVEPVLVLLHVLPAVEYPDLGLFNEREPPARQQEDMLEFLQKEAQKRLGEDPPPKIVCRLSRGVPFKEICRIAEEEKAELIVIGTHGRTGLSHLLIGSTAERVVQHASCPVLSIKPKLL